MAPQKKVLGYLAFGMVVAAFVISVVAMMPMLPMLAEAVTSTQFGNQEEAQLVAEQIIAQFPLAGLFLNLASLLGLGGLVVGIIAVVRRAGRGWGVAAIVAAVLAPILLIVVVVFGLMAQLP